MNGAGDNIRVKFCQPDFKAIYHALSRFFVDMTTDIQPMKKADSVAFYFLGHAQWGHDADLGFGAGTGWDDRPDRRDRVGNFFSFG